MALLRVPPARLLLLGYLTYMLTGWALLALPIAQSEPLASSDTLFIAASAISTTGLVTVDPGSSFTFFGQIVILALIQVGGLGYMTIGSFAVLALRHRLSGMRVKATRAAFNLPDDIHPVQFIKGVIGFTVACEILGAAALWPMLKAAGTDAPAWSAIFHSISAFCTAGFSLNPDSFLAFQDHAGVNLVLAVLSLAGAMGFLIGADLWRTLTGRKPHLGFTSKVIVRMTVVLVAIGTAIVFTAVPTDPAPTPEARILTAFFQAVSASTTVGFNTIPIDSLGAPALICLIVLMVIGASPAGTGGGLKTTSLAALVGLVRSTLKGRDRIRFFKRRVPLKTLQTAAASLTFFCGLLVLSLLVLSYTDPVLPLEAVAFEAISAMGTVGLTTGITGDISVLGDLFLVILMTAGRVGILTFGIALAARDETREEERDNALIL